MITFDSNILIGYYQARAGVIGGVGGAAGGSKKVAPTAPWSAQAAPAQTSAAVKSALLGRKIIDENAAKLDLPSASADYKKLFALYQGLDTLMGVATQAQGKTVSSFELARLEKTFANGLAEVSDYVRTADFEQLRLTAGAAATSARATVGVPKPRTEYVTTPLVSGSSAGVVPAFQGNVQFDMNIKRLNVTSTVSIDLADMGAQPRTFVNVLAHINQELTNAGFATRFATQRIPAQPRMIESGGKTITLPPGPDQWALKVKVDSGETVGFSAPATAPAIYMAQSVGDPDPDGKASTNDGVTQRQLLKFQTDVGAVPSPPQVPGEAHWVDGRVFAETLGPEVKTVRATTVGLDGAVYMLADITAKTGDQEIKGYQDVALLKYDAAGNLVYRRTLGAADQASGLALSVATDGKVAIAGSVTGALGGAVEGPMNSGTSGSFATNSDSFVTLFDKDGQEVWTQRRGARMEDEASQVAFGADGTVYVAGRAKSAMPGGGAIGGWDGYIQAFKADALGKIQTLFTQTYGTTGEEKPAGLVVDGTSVVIAGAEAGRGVLRRFDVSGATPALTATRDLGDLQGGTINGLALDGGQVVVAGTTRNAALSVGTITHNHAGGYDAFAARLSADLGAGGGDRLAYYGGAGDDKAASLAVSGGRVWLAGSAGTDLPNQAPVGTKDGFLAELDLDSGAVAWSRRFTGKDGQAAPSAIAVDAQGASVLDRLGLPKGVLTMSDSSKLTAVTSLRAGDQFTVRVGEGRAAAVTIENQDTLDILATKVRRALGFQGKVEIVTVEGTRRLQIKPLNDRNLIEIGAGKGGKDVLAMLGIPEGLVRATKVDDDGKTVPADGKPNIYGLGLPSDLNLRDADQIKHALAELAAAMGVIRTAYRDLVSAATPKSATSSVVSGPVPAYLTNQIANYQAALNRLTGGA